MRTLITIGELASLYGIKTTKIRFYERKGLIQSVRVENDYRLYDFENLDKLGMILLLRDMDVPLERIQELLNGYDQEEYKDLLIDIKKETEQQIKTLKSRLKVVENRIKLVTDYATQKAEFVSRKERKYREITSHWKGYSHVKDFHDLHRKYNLRLSNYEDIYVFKFNDDKTLSTGVQSDNPSLRELPIRTIESGTYAIVRLKDVEFEKGEEIRNEIIRIVEEEGYSVKGPLYMIEDYQLVLFSNTSEYVAFEVRVEKKS